MSQIYFAILTAVGEAKLANATALGTQLQISRMAVGDGNGTLPTPNRSQTALLNERYRADLNTLQVDPLNTSQIIAELVIPETEGGYWLREMGLYDAAGDLLAVSNCPPSYKPQLAEGSGRTQVLRMVLIVSSTAAVQLKIDPSVVLATRAYADSVITVHQAAADPHPQYKLRGAVTTLTGSATITAAQIGLLLLDASGGNRTFTLPAASAGLGVRELVVRRIDLSANALVIVANGADKLLLDTIAEAAGQASTVLLFAGDFLRLRSDGAGKWWCVGQAQLPGSIASGFVVYPSTGSFTFSVPPVLRSGRRFAKVIVKGGGGGGGYWNASPSASGGGGGGVSEKRVSLSGVSTVPVTVGIGGTGAVLNGYSGSAGGTSSFGAYCSATGGAAGTASGNGSAGGMGTGGDLNYSIGDGGAAVAGPSGSIFGGAGGGAVSIYAATDSGRPRAPGCGGGGRTGSAGANGADGLVLIQW